MADFMLLAISVLATLTNVALTAAVYRMVAKMHTDTKAKTLGSTPAFVAPPKRRKPRYHDESWELANEAKKN